MEEPNLISDAANIREIYLNKPFPKGNIAIVEVRLEDGKAFGMGATSRANSPAPKPEPKSKGGQFEPTVDSYSGRTTPMDTDAEYKVLSAIAETLEYLSTIMIITALEGNCIFTQKENLVRVVNVL